MTSTSESTTPQNTSAGRVYLDLYGLREAPFSITPDPEFMFLSRTHQSAIERLQYGVGNRMGFMILTGEVGTGKTTLCRYLLEELAKTANTVYILNPTLTGKELLQSILDDLGLSYPQRSTKKQLIDKLNAFLLSPGRDQPTVLIVDDAQVTSCETLEQLRLLSNLETDKFKLLQIILVGQPELEDRLEQHDMRQLKQRISIHCRLDFLNPGEVGEYIARRLYCCGNKGSLRFTEKSVALIHRQSGGIPRIINCLCDYALVSGYVANDFTITPEHIHNAIRETGLRTVRHPFQFSRRITQLLEKLFQRTEKG
jgi:general secretion pathway protein A